MSLSAPGPLEQATRRPKMELMTFYRTTGRIQARRGRRSLSSDRSDRLPLFIIYGIPFRRTTSL